jgi:hypothetical protein
LNAKKKTSSIACAQTTHGKPAYINGQWGHAKMPASCAEKSEQQKGALLVVMHVWWSLVGVRPA